MARAAHVADHLSLADRGAIRGGEVSTVRVAGREAGRVLDSRVVAVAADPAHQRQRAESAARMAVPAGTAMSTPACRRPSAFRTATPPTVHGPDDAPLPADRPADPAWAPGARPARAPARPRAPAGRPPATLRVSRTWEARALVRAVAASSSRDDTSCSSAVATTLRCRRSSSATSCSRSSRSTSSRPGRGRHHETPHTGSVISRSCSETRSRNSARSSNSRSRSASSTTVSASGASDL